MAVLTQIGGAVTSVGSNPYALGIILISNSSNGMTPLSSMVLTSLLGLTGIPMAIGALTCTGSSFVNYVLFSRLNIGGSKSKAFAVFVEPLTQIDLIAKIPSTIIWYERNYRCVNACIVTFSGLVIGVKVWQHQLQVQSSYSDLTMLQNQLLQSSSLRSKCGISIYLQYVN